MSDSPAHAPAGVASSPDALLHRMERVRALAGQLVRQAADQDDLVQEAIARALAKPREIEGDPEPWIRRVVRNLAIDRGRAATRRRNYEGESARDAGFQESTADSIERAEQQRDLVTAVLQLKEPYRAVILQRFFDGLPPREIARRQGVPVATVKKQQERGMAMLRRELEARYGGEGTWAVALLPLLPRSALKALGSGALGGSTTVVSVAGLVSAAAVALTCVVLMVIRQASTPMDEALLPKRAAAAARVADAPQTLPIESATGARVGGVPAPAAFSATAESLGSSWPGQRVFTGTFVDEAGTPVENVSARCRVEGGGGTLEGEAATGSAAGVVVASIDAARDAAMVVNVWADGFAPATYRFRPVASDSESSPAPMIDVGRQTLFRPTELVVRVVDESGLALLGWEMSYLHYGGGDRLEWERAHADPIAGRAEFDGVPAAEVEVMAEHPSGLEIHHPRRLLGREGPNAIDLVHVGPHRSRRIGVQLDWPAASVGADGASVAVSLVADGERLTREPVPLGRQALAFDDLGPGDYMLVIDDPRFEAIAAAARPGESTRLELVGTARMQLAVHDPNGRRVTDYALELSSRVVPNSDGVPVRRRLGTASASGLLEGLVPGQPFTLRLIASDGRQAVRHVASLLPSETRILNLTLGDGVTAVEVRVVRAGHNEPVAGAEVAVFSGSIPPGSRLESHAVLLASGGDPVPSLRLVAAARTDEAGVASLVVASDEVDGPLTALAIAGDHALARVVDGRAQLVLSARGQVRARLDGVPAAAGAAPTVPSTGLPEGMALTLTWPGSVARHRAPFGPGVILEPDGHGSFLTALAPDGPATVWLSFSDFNHRGRGTTLGARTGPIGFPLGTVMVAANALSEVKLDASSYWPGSLDVVAQHAGLPLGDAVVDLEPVGSHAHLPYPFESTASVSRILTRITDGAGRARFPRVPSGRWRVRVRDSEWLWVSEASECEIESGAFVRREFTVDLAEGSVTVVGPATGLPLRHRVLYMETAPGVQVRRSTDGAGRLRLRLAPGGYPIMTGPSLDESEAAAILDWQIDGPVHTQLVLVATDR